MYLVVKFGLPIEGINPIDLNKIPHINNNGLNLPKNPIVLLTVKHLYEQKHPQQAHDKNIANIRISFPKPLTIR